MAFSESFGWCVHGGFGNFFWTSCQQTVILLNVNKLDINCQLASFLKACSLCRLDQKHTEKNSTRFWSCIKHFYSLDLGEECYAWRTLAYCFTVLKPRIKTYRSSFRILSRSPNGFFLIWRYFKKECLLRGKVQSRKFKEVSVLTLVFAGWGMEWKEIMAEVECV